MSAAAGRRSAPRPAMSIGEVLAQLRPEFPDVTISKIRFLEEQGLVEPQRTASGYRKFDHADLERLRYVLSVQRDHYLPLRVIREHLQAMDRGADPPVLPGMNPSATALRPARLLPDPIEVGPEPAAAHPAALTGVDELAAAAGVGMELVRHLEEYGLVAPRASGGYDRDAVLICRTAGELAAFGIEPRHLRAFRSAAEREAGLVEQVVAPLRRQRGTGSAAQSQETGREVAALCVRLHAALLKSALLKSVLDRGSG